MMKYNWKQNYCLIPYFERYILCEIIPAMCTCWQGKQPYPGLRVCTVTATYITRQPLSHSFGEWSCWVQEHDRIFVMFNILLMTPHQMYPRSFLQMDLEALVFNQYRLTTLQCVLLLASCVTWYQAGPPVRVGCSFSTGWVTSHILATVLPLTSHVSFPSSTCLDAAEMNPRETLRATTVLCGLESVCNYVLGEC